jgi:hypothetical protein
MGEIVGILDQSDPGGDDGERRGEKLGLYETETCRKAPHHKHKDEGANTEPNLEIGAGCGSESEEISPSATLLALGWMRHALPGLSGSAVNLVAVGCRWVSLIISLNAQDQTPAA